MNDFLSSCVIKAIPLVAAMTRASEYFEGQARGYQQRSSGPLWRWLRAREARAVMRLLEPTAGEEILDAGCGAGFYSQLLVGKGARPLGVDLTPAMVEAARRANLDAVEGDLATVSLGRTFGKVLCAGALEFCPDPDRVIANLARHLQPGGRLTLLYPACSAGGRVYRWYHRHHGVTVRLFGRWEIERMAERAGLACRQWLRPSFSHVVRADKIG